MQKLCASRQEAVFSRLLLLLLLLLLRAPNRRGWRLLCLLHQQRPFFRNRESLIELRGIGRRRHANGHGQLTGGVTTEDSFGWGYVGIVTSDGGADVAVAG